MAIAYDASFEGLLSPSRAETVFKAGTPYTHLQLGLESTRLAYYQAEDQGAQLARLTAAMHSVGFNHVQHFNVALGTQAFAAYRDSDQLAIIAFRGTQATSLFDIGVDASAVLTAWPAGGQVHSGFAQAFDAARTPLTDWLSTSASKRVKLILCGHSLGAALATLGASIWRPSLLIAVGSPRVGDAAFVDSLKGISYHRIFNCCDLVARVPPQIGGFQHLPSATFVTWDAQVLTDPSASEVDQSRHRGRKEYFNDYALRFGNVPTRDLADHAPVNYLRAFFP